MNEKNRIYQPADLIEGNLVDMHYIAEHDEVEVERRIAANKPRRLVPLSRSQTIFEIGKRAMRRITRSGR